MTDTQTAVLSDPAYRVHDTWLLVGRIILVVIFISSGAQKFMNLSGVAGMIGSKGLPAPQVLAAVTAAVELFGGLAVAIGFHTRLAAIGLALFTLVATYFFHDFWNLEGAARQMQMINAMKNFSIVGAFLMLAAVGGGRYSVDGRVRTRASL